MPVFPKNVFSQCALTVDSPIAEHVAWAATHIYAVPYPNHPDIDGIARYHHGAQHVARTACYIPILANLYRQYDDVEALALESRDLKLLQLAALFHDSGRAAEGVDLWDADSALNVYFYLQQLGVSHNEAKKISEAVANKDGTFLSHDLVLIENEPQWNMTRNESAQSKNIYAKLIHDADCLDVIRRRVVFRGEKLDFCRDIVNKQKNSVACRDMAKLIVEVRSLIDTQGDNVRKQNSAVKKKYEHNSVELYHLIIADIETGLIPGTGALLRPFMAAYFNRGQLLDSKFSHDLMLEEKPQTATWTWMNGTLFARGISTPSAIMVKSAEKLSKLKSSDKRIDESIAAFEVRKIAREMHQPTLSGHLQKQGNVNRSCNLLMGYGDSVYSNAGFLIINNEFSNIKKVNSINSGSGYGKRKILPTEDKVTIEKKLDQVFTRSMLGGEGIDIHGYIATHNEIVLGRVSKDMIYGVFFTNDPNRINSRVAQKNGYALHPHVPILEAIYIQNQYRIEAGDTLPIYEFSGIHNFLTPRSFTEQQIIDMWQEVCEHHIKNFSREYILPFDVTLFEKYAKINKIKILAMHREMNGFDGVKHASADGNYHRDLIQAIDYKIMELLEKYQKTHTEIFYTIGAPIQIKQSTSLLSKLFCARLPSVLRDISPAEIRRSFSQHQFMLFRTEEDAYFYARSQRIGNFHTDKVVLQSAVFTVRYPYSVRESQFVRSTFHVFENFKNKHSEGSREERQNLMYAFVEPQGVTPLVANMKVELISGIRKEYPEVQMTSEEKEIIPARKMSI